MDSVEMDPLAAVETFAGFPSRNKGAASVAGRHLQVRVVAGHLVLGDRDIGRVGDEDTLEPAISDREPLHDDIAEPGELARGNIRRGEIVHAVDVNADTVASVAARINDRVCRVEADKRQRFVDDHMLSVSALSDADRVARIGGGYPRANRRVASLRALRVNAKGVGRGRLLRW